MDLMEGVNEPYETANVSQGFWAQMQERANYLQNSDDYYESLKDNNLNSFSDDEQKLEDDSLRRFPKMTTPQYRARRLKRLYVDKPDEYQQVLHRTPVERMNTINTFTKPSKREWVERMNGNAEDEDEYEHYYTHVKPMTTAPEGELEASNTIEPSMYPQPEDANANSYEKHVRKKAILEPLVDTQVKVVQIRAEHAMRLYDKLRESAKDTKKYLKDTFAGDIHRYTPETMNWLKDVQPTLREIQPVFGDNEILTLATAMAACEELNRHGNFLTRHTDAIQDKIVADKGEISPLGGFVSPHLGVANINYATAKDLRNRFKELPNLNHPYMQEMHQKIHGSEKELSQYMLTAQGTFMLGHSIMYLIMKDVQTNKLFPDEHSEADRNFSKTDKIQNLIDIWRQGPTRIKLMIENKAKAEAEGLIYSPIHKHQGKTMTELNYNDAYPIIYPQRIDNSEASP